MPYAALIARHEELVSGAVVFNKWQYPLLETFCHNPGGCCYGLFCTPCMAYQQRERILENLQQPYQPCGGACCCCPCPPIVTSPMREYCMCCEVCCCPYLATLVNRDLVLYNYRVDFDPCDEFIINCVLCLDCILGVVAIFDERFRALKDLVDLILLLIMSCSLAQQESQLDVVTQTDTCAGGNYATKAGVAHQRLPDEQGPEGGYLEE